MVAGKIVGPIGAAAGDARNRTERGGFFRDQWGDWPVGECGVNPPARRAGGNSGTSGGRVSRPFRDAKRNEIRPTGVAHVGTGRRFDEFRFLSPRILSQAFGHAVGSESSALCSRLVGSRGVDRTVFRAVVDAAKPTSADLVANDLANCGRGRGASGDFRGR